MSSSTLSSPVEPGSPSPAPPKKGRKPSLVVQFKLNGEALKKFSPPSTEVADSPSSAESGRSSAVLPVDVPVASPAVQVSSPPNSDSNKPETPAKTNGANGKAPTSTARKRGTPGGSSLRPGAKKRQKVDGQSPGINGITHSSKLGPKTNAGAINANLRALDRSGAPCKRWSRGEFKLKSFTGIEWTIKTFTAEKRVATDSQPASDAASVASAASPGSIADAPTPMEGIEAARTPEIVIDEVASINGVVHGATQMTPQPLVAPVG